MDRSQMIGDEYCLLKDLGEGTFGNVKLGKHNFEKGDMFSINLEALGHSSAQWIRPMEMLPERFD